VSRLVLASGSPRRHRLLHEAGFEFAIVTPEVDESRRQGERPGELVLRLARDKAATVPPSIVGQSAVVVAADTVVAVGDDVLGKPVDAEDAVAMLNRLSGSTHQVLTGWVVRADGKSAAEGVETTDVSFRVLDAADIRAYVAGGEPLDKAGAYAIQGGAAPFVATLAGSYSNVVGLPVERVTEALARLSVVPVHPPG